MVDLLEIKKFLEEQTNKIKPIQTKAQLSYWNAVTSGDEEYYKKYEELQLEIQKIFNNKKDFEKIKEFMKKGVEDPLSKRQLEILYESYLGSQGDLDLIKKMVKKTTEIERKFNIFRTKINNEEVPDSKIKEILETETNSEKLREAWEANKKVGEVVGKELVELVKLRNKFVKELGFNNYYSMSMELGEQKEEEIAKIFKELADLTEEPFKKLKKEIDSVLVKRYKISEKELKPWHYHDLYFQEGPKIHKIDLDGFYSIDILNIAKKFYESIGMPVDNILKRSDLYERPKKYPHACCMDIDREGDIRIIENLKNNEKWMETTLHELGHAVYGKFIDRSLPYILKWPAHMFATEAIALLFGRNSRNLAFVKEHCEVGKEEIDKTSGELAKALRLRQLVFLRWSQVMFNFERELYKNPKQDLNKLWWGLVKKYQLIDFLRDKPDWASKIHLVSNPVYYHNYLLGELLASQLHNHIVKNILKETSIENSNYSNRKDIGEYLKKFVFSPGMKYGWNEMIKRATGENLTPKYFAKEFVSE